MATVDESQVYTALAIRDTNTHNSATADTGEFTAETILVYNGLDQSVTLQLQGSRDGSTWLNIGNTFNVSSTTNSYETVTDYFPCYRLTAVCSGGSPTSGVLDAWILKTGAIN
jgi:hypothetical protein